MPRKEQHHCFPPSRCQGLGLNRLQQAHRLREMHNPMASQRPDSGTAAAAGLQLWHCRAVSTTLVGHIALSPPTTRSRQLPVSTGECVSTADERTFPDADSFSARVSKNSNSG